MIGFFDSGMGGLTVLKEFKALRPEADVVYFGDTKNAPYGTKTREELGALTVLGFQRLIAEGASGIVSACNSVSASIALPMFDILGIEDRSIIEMVGPTVEHFRDKGHIRLLIAATPATIRSGLYRLALEHIGMRIVELPIPQLAGAIEAGRPKEELDRIVEDAFAPLPAASFDTVLLACTHYPLVHESFERALYRKGSDAVLVDPARFVATRAAERLHCEGGGSLRFILSAESAPFRERADALFGGSSFTIEVGQKNAPHPLGAAHGASVS